MLPAPPIQLVKLHLHPTVECKPVLAVDQYVKTILIDPQEPVVCLDEKPVTLHADVRLASLAEPGREARRDNEYDPRGTANFSVR